MSVDPMVAGEETGILRLDEELMIYQVAQTWSLINETFKREAQAGQQTDLRLDCRALREIDGAGFQLLWLAARHLAGVGARLRLIGLGDALRGQLQVLDAAGLFVHESAEAA